MVSRCRWLALVRPTMDEEAFTFPRELPGLDPALNWSLNGDGVTPKGTAVRMTKAKFAASLVGGKVAAATGPSTCAHEEEDEDYFGEAMDVSVGLLEAANALYVAEGDAPGTRVPCRIISDDVDFTASAMTHALDRMPLNKIPFELPITAYVTPKGLDAAVLHFPSADLAKIILSGKHATTNELKATLEQAAKDIVLRPFQTLYPRLRPENQPDDPED